MLVGSGSDLSSDCFQSATCMVKGEPGTWAIFTPHLEFPFSGFLSSRIPSSFCVATGCPLRLPLTPPTRKTCSLPFLLQIPFKAESHPKKKNPGNSLCGSLLPPRFDSAPKSLCFCFCSRALRYLFLAFFSRAYAVISGKVSLLGGGMPYLCFLIVTLIASTFDTKLPAVLYHAVLPLSLFNNILRKSNVNALKTCYLPPLTNYK